MSTPKTSCENPAHTSPLEEGQEPAQTERQVFLREGTVILRWIFGYYDEQNLPGWTSPPQWPHTFSTWLLNKRQTRFKEVTFVGIDIDELRESNGMPTQFHIGVSTLRTTDLHDLCHSSASVADAVASYPLGNAIQSHHWVVEDPNYFNKNDSRFCFGKYRCIPLSDFKQALEKLLKQFHPLIFVCHGISRERIVLGKLNIDLKPLFEIDTTKAARYPLQEFHDSTLKKLVKNFEIPFSSELFHFAGNDAHYVLRVLLMIAVNDARRELGHIPIWVTVFEAVARAPLPPMPLKRAQKAAIKRREKRDPAQLAASQERWTNVLRSRQEDSSRNSEMADLALVTLSLSDTREV